MHRRSKQDEKSGAPDEVAANLRRRLCRLRSDPGSLRHCKQLLPLAHSPGGHETARTSSHSQLADVHSSRRQQRRYTRLLLCGCSCRAPQRLAGGLQRSSAIV